MTEAQNEWLASNPNYSPVRRGGGVITFVNWTDEGYLFANGRFTPDDGKTLFPHKYPSWFPGCRAPDAVRVGRKYEIV